MGLMCALELLKHGHEVDVYERDDRIGGMSASFDFDGLEIERYYHFICKTDQPLFDMLDELGIADRLRWVDTRMGFYYNGRLHPWGTPWALLRFKGLGPVSKLRYALHVMYTKNISDWRKLDKRNAVEWLKRWLGARTYDVLWRSLFDLKFYQYADQLSAAWIGTRIKRVALSRRSLLQESLGYLDGGSKTLLDAMQSAITARGGRIHLQAGIDKACVEGGKLVGIEVLGQHKACDALVSTAPIQYLPRLIPDMPADLASRIAAIRNIPVACVILKLRHRLSPNFWTNINDPSIDLPGLIEYSNLNDVGANIVYAPFYMPTSHPKWSRGNGELIDEVKGYLHKINPDFSEDWVLASHCHRYAFAQTVCPPGFYEQLPPMQTQVEGLFIADTCYYYPEDRSIAESFRTAKKLAHVALGQATVEFPGRDAPDASGPAATPS